MMARILLTTMLPPLQDVQRREQYSGNTGVIFKAALWTKFPGHLRPVEAASSHCLKVQPILRTCMAAASGATSAPRPQAITLSGSQATTAVNYGSATMITLPEKSSALPLQGIQNR